MNPKPIRYRTIIFTQCLNIALALFVVAIMAETAFGIAEFENDQVRISVKINSNVYKYEISNLNDSRIVAFEIPQHASYKPSAPDGWESEITKDRFSAWVGGDIKGIPVNGTGTFSLCVSSEGAYLGNVVCPCFMYQLL